jgi:hypothetical protein
VRHAEATLESLRNPATDDASAEPSEG